MLEQELQKICDGEISVQIGWFWNGGIEVKLGDEINGYVAETNVPAVAHVLPWLQEAIARYYPRSKYNLDRLRGRSTGEVIPFPVSSDAERAGLNRGTGEPPDGGSGATTNGTSEPANSTLLTPFSRR